MSYLPKAPFTAGSDECYRGEILQKHPSPLPDLFLSSYNRRITAHLDPFTVINSVRGTTIHAALHWTEQSLPRAPFEIS